MLDATGAVLSQQRYYPFGGARLDPGVTQTDFSFTGQRGTDFGLMDYRARFYSSRLGRFTQPDTLIPDPANPQSFNRYSYVQNSPLNFVDPSGHRYIPLIDGIGGTKCRFDGCGSGFGRGNDGKYYDEYDSGKEWVDTYLRKDDEDEWDDPDAPNVMSLQDEDFVDAYELFDDVHGPAYELPPVRLGIEITCEGCLYPFVGIIVDGAGIFADVASSLAMLGLQPEVAIPLQVYAAEIESAYFIAGVFLDEVTIYDAELYLAT